MKEGEHETKPPRSFESIASLIAGDCAPEWLPQHLRRWATSVSLDRAVQKRQPARKKMKKRLAEVKAAASLLRCALRQPSTREFLEIPPFERIANRGVLEQCLGDLADRADRGLKSPLLTNAVGKTKAGTGRAMPPGAVATQIYCAMMIAEIWKLFRGRYPGVNNCKAAQAANDYWLVCGNCSEDNHWRKLFQNENMEWSGGSLTRWRRFFEKARPPVMAAERAEYGRHLREAQRHGN